VPGTEPELARNRSKSLLLASSDPGAAGDKRRGLGRLDQQVVGRLELDVPPAFSRQTSRVSAETAIPGIGVASEAVGDVAGLTAAWEL